MNSTCLPADCAQLGALIEALGEDAPDRLVTHTILTHVATCPTCCPAEAHLTALLADYHFTAPPALPASTATRLMDRICAQWRTTPQGDFR
jgi:hypothetical protein